MANRDPAHQPFVVPGRRDPVLDAARVVMLYGAVGAVATVGSRSPPADATQAVGNLFLWLLGVCLLAFVPTEGRFPRAALVVAAAMANAVLKHFVAPWN